MAKVFKLKVNTPDGLLFEDDIYQIELKTINGVIGILANHEPIIGSIVPSICYVTTINGGRVSALVNTGIFKMDGKTINLITDFFQFTENVNDSIIEKRKQAIENAVKNQNFKDDAIFDSVQRKLEKELEELSKLSHNGK